MTSAETFTVIAIPMLAGWAFYSMRRAMRHDVACRAELKEFAKTKGLAERVVERAPGEIGGNTTITWKMIRKTWSRNPAMAAPAKGAAVFKGTNNGFPFVMDEVRIRKYWTNLHDSYLRMAIELPGLPGTLAISPAGKLGSTNPRQRANFSIRFSAAAGERAQERGYLTAYRVRLLEELQEMVGGVYVNDGKLFVIRRTDAGGEIDLNTLYDALGMCAKMLAV